MAKTIRQLNVVVDVNASPFERGMAAVSVGIDKAKREWDAKFGKMAGVTNQWANSLLGIGAATAGIGVKAATDLATYAEELENIQQQTGLTTDQLQTMKYVLDQSGKDFNTAMNGVWMFQQKLLGIEDDSGDAAEAVKRLGVDALDANDNILPMAQVIPQIITRLQGMRNEAQRNMFAFAIFGKGWKELLPVLAMTPQQLRNAETELRNMGGLLSGKTLTGAKELDDRLDQLNQKVRVFWLQLGEAAAPLVKFGTDLAGALNKVNPKLILIAGGIATVIGLAIKLYNWGTQLKYMLAGIQTAQMLGGGAGASAGTTGMAAGFAGIAKSIGVVALRLGALVLIIRNITLGMNVMNGEFDGFLTRSGRAKGQWQNFKDIWPIMFGLAPRGGMVSKLQFNKVDINDRAAVQREIEMLEGLMQDIQKETLDVDPRSGEGAVDAADIAAISDRILKLREASGLEAFIPGGNPVEDNTSEIERLNKAKYDVAQRVIRERTTLEAATTGRLERQNRLISDYYAATDAGERMRLAAEIERNQLAHQQEMEALALSNRRYREVYGAANQAAVDAVNDKYDLEQIRLTEAQKAAMEALEYRQRKEQELHDKQMEMDRARYDAQKASILEVANSYLQYNRDYVRGIEAGFKKLDALRAGAGQTTARWFDRVPAPVGPVMDDAMSTATRARLAALAVTAPPVSTFEAPWSQHVPAAAGRIAEIRPSKYFDVAVDGRIQQALDREAALTPGG
ncbi:MAG: phage tail tape measure protein [Armatimonadota bacterium]